MTHILRHIALVLALIFVGISADADVQDYDVKQLPYFADLADGHITEYLYDGLGRKEQRVEKGITPSGADLVSLTEYGSLNRKYHLWLPAVMTDNDGARVDTETLRRASRSTNIGDGHPYSVIGYEASPLGRVNSRMGEGMVWHAADKAVGIRWSTNSGSVEHLKCIRFKCNLNYTSFALEKCGFYDAGELSVTREEDEEGQTVLTFTNPLGRRILERRICDDESAADTYYVYDSFGRLSLVIPPMASREIAQMTASHINSSHAAIADYCYAYYYDKRHRCIGRKLPGADWIYQVYDRADRLTFSQTGNQRREGVWAFSIYDRFGRLALVGECDNAINVFARQQNVVYATRSVADNALKGYSVSNFTPENPRIFTVNYYDDHDFMGRNGVPDGTSRYGYEALSGFDARYRNAKGVQTGALTAVLDDADTPAYLPAVVYRDIRGREVQSVSANRLGGIDKRFTARNFVGQPTLQRHEHTTSAESHTDIYRHAYDHAGRLTSLEMRRDGGSITTLQTNTYNELGRLIRQTLHDGATSIDYTYNVRGWLKTIESPNFSQSLYYELKPDYSAGCYNGNLSANHISLISENDTIRTTQSFEYEYQYDSLNRLIKADITGCNVIFDLNSIEAASESRILTPLSTSLITPIVGQYIITDTPYYSTEYTYDLNSNVTELERCGKSDNDTNKYRILSNLRYSYSGNQVNRISDEIAYTPHSSQVLFADLSDEDVEYSWDANGNMTSDLNKGITSIEYNALNLPRRMTFANGHIIEYLYDAAGRKLQTKYLVDNRSIFAASTDGEIEDDELMATADSTAVETLLTRDYVGNYIYADGAFERLLTPMGDYTPTDGHRHFLRDYQGNTMAVMKGNKVVQQNKYYPDGTPFSASAYSTNRYLYSGKEFDRMYGLDWYDVHARWHDPLLGRFTTPDPLAEKYYAISPYAFCAANPVMFTDPTGMEPTEEEAARIADYVTGDDLVELIGGWTVSNEFEIVNEQSGLKAMYFERTIDGKKEYVLAFSGTDFTSTDDWENNALQVIGQSKQYSQAMEIASKRRNEIPGELTFVGYSLGGGLAAASAYATGGRAITFNAAGVSPFTVNTASGAKIDAYINYRDELNYYQSILPFVPTANGTKHFRFGNNSILGHDIKNFYK